MEDVKGRPLSRTERALQTRLRMTRAAYELFTERGYPATTMADIAARAGVAVQTLHFTFGTKAALLQNAYDYAVLGEGENIPPEQQPWYAEFLAADSLTTALDILVRNVSTVLSRTAPLDHFVRSAAYQPDAARIRSHTELMRRQAWSGMVEHLHHRFGLTTGTELRWAVDVLMLVMSPMSYHTLVNECGWSDDQWRAWCTSAISLQLFNNPA
jgi:AcrR family transcriptional regulator